MVDPAGVRAVIIVSDRIGNVTRTRYEQLVAEARDLINQMAKAQFALGDKALEIEPMRPVGGSMPNGTDDLFTAEESLQMFADDIGVARSTVEDWRWTASRWPEAKRKDGVSFTVHKIPASIQDENERWAAIEDAPVDAARARTTAAFLSSPAGYRPRPDGRLIAGRRCTRSAGGGNRQHRAPAAREP
ncbi:DUF6192 family protein [Streptomyces eurythermus]|uniref:DUF6192 family protein n=1 Tax=Streptomyces eurythermus TaxID=42237 RepID=UPI0033F0323E